MNIAIFYEHREIGSSGFYVERALRSLGHNVTYFRKSELKKTGPEYDLFMRTEDGEYDYAFLPHQHPVVYWAMDTHIPFSLKRILKEAPQYDIVFCCHQSGVRRIGEARLRVRWLPVACDHELHRRIEAPVKFEVSSIGKEEGVPRKFLLQEIRERYNPTFIKKADFRLMREVYSASKIGFNQAINRDLNMRVFEVAASGAMLLSSELEDDSYERLGLKDGEHLVIFRSPRDLFEKLDYYLAPAHENERKRIAASGHMLVLQHHTYRHRMEEMIKVLTHERILTAASLTMQMGGISTAPFGQAGGLLR